LFFLPPPAPTVLYPLSLHDALPILTSGIFGVPASTLVDRIVPLEDLWARDDVERLFASVSRLEIRRGLSTLSDELLARFRRASRDRKSTRLNSSHVSISYAVFCLKK